MYVYLALETHQMSISSYTIKELLSASSPGEQLCDGETNTLWQEHIKLNPGVPKSEEKITMSLAKN